MYKLIKNIRTQQVDVVNKIEDGFMLSIPFDPANTDAKEFALWLQAGNKPEPAEEGGVVTDEWVAETIAKLLP